jgi:L-cysteine desulfidase
MPAEHPHYYDAYLSILREELIPAMGCTEPIAVAFAAALARDTLGMRPEHAQIKCSANIVKNVKSVTVPNTGGMHGIAAAAIAGIVGGTASAKLEVLESVTEKDWAEIRRLLAAEFCTATLAEGIEGLYIEAIVTAGYQRVEVIIQNSHTGVARIRKNDVTIFERKDRDATGTAGSSLPYELLNVHDIIQFANVVDIEDVSDLLKRQIHMNEAIANEGLTNNYGAAIGKTILEREEHSVRSRARAKAAAGSDARMGGCPLPVVINSGSGNQGLTVSLPVIEYARELHADREKLLRALVLSNLIALEQKSHIGKLSAYCGAVSAAVGSGAAITYLHGGSDEQIAMTITNAIATASGILCDGAKSSCAAKIATALEAAILAHEMSMRDRAFSAGEGLVGDQVEQTIRNFSHIGSVGMRPTDIEIIKIMLDQ